MSRITRRRFVESSLATGVFLASSPAVTKAKSPNEKIGVAVIGAGGRGNAHLAQFVDEALSGGQV